MRVFFAIAVCTCVDSTAHAAIFTVGTGAGCSHGTIQSAINAAEASAGADTVRVTRSLTYSAEANSINTSQNLNLVGGFATCSQSATDNGKTTISGAGGSTEPVFRITANTGSIIKLRHLTISDGDEDGTGKGGGIYFRGDGGLEVIETTITNNTAGNGGGIYAEGTGTNAELVLSADVLITSNSARYSGGGVFAEGLEMTMTAPGSLIAFNEATGQFNAQLGQIIGGYGGGLLVLGGSLDGYAYIGSPGIGSTGPIYSNEARYGGGLAVISNTAFARANIFGTSTSQRTSINQNFASVSGGGLYVFSADRGGFVIGAFAQAVLWNADITGNAAPNGAAAHVAETPGTFPVGYAGLSINSGVTPAGAQACQLGSPCAFVTGNQDQNTSGQPTGGAVLLVQSNNYIDINRVELSGNRGGEVLRASGGSTDASALNTLWAENITSNQLIRTSDDVDLLLESSSIVGNAIGAAQVVSANGRFRMQRSILWQPGKTSLTQSGGSKSVENVLTSERTSLDGGNTPYVLEDAPRFIDAARGDYGLRAASLAVDFASSGAGDDLLGVQRGIDLPNKFNRMGSADLGAFERPTLSPLVLNADFNGDLNLWLETTPAASTWSSAQNASGPAGSGSVFVSLSNITQPRIYARAQCIHLPGPGRYSLNGWGRTASVATINSDSAFLHWELRRNGTEECNAGAPDVVGDHFLAKGGWARPATPAFIDLLEQDWTYTSSITVYLVVNDNGITFPPSATGWFDGITLDVESTDKIFADDFEL